MKNRSEKEINMENTSNGSICGADCGACEFRDNCKGCRQTKGCPFGKQCMVARYILVGGMEKYLEFKRVLIDEFNALNIHGMDRVEELYPLVGKYVNLEYTLPGGQRVKFLSDDEVYLGNQPKNLCDESGERCYGVIAGMGFLLVCEYGKDISDPEIVAFMRR